MVCFQTKNPNLGKFLKDLAMEYVGVFYGHLVHFTVFCYIFITFLWHLEKFIEIWYILSRFDILFQEKSGNPDLKGLWGNFWSEQNSNGNPPK
jgi:hypothetical protein